jgi:hypothetical protein
MIEVHDNNRAAHSDLYIPDSRQNRVRTSGRAGTGIPSASQRQFSGMTLSPYSPSRGANYRRLTPSFAFLRQLYTGNTLFFVTKLDMAAA